MPDFFGVYDDMKVIEYLEFFAAAYRIKGAEPRQKCDQVLELVDLGYKRDALVDQPVARHDATAGAGPRAAARSASACCSTSRPPASTRAPASRCATLLKELRSMGKTIMVSSHILPELADICNKIGIIERGKLIFNGTVEEAIGKVRTKRVYIVSVGPEQNELAAKKLEQFVEVEAVELTKEAATIRVTLKDGEGDGTFIPSASSPRSSGCTPSTRSRSIWKTCSWASRRASRIEEKSFHHRVTEDTERRTSIRKRVGPLAHRLPHHICSSSL